MLTRTEFRRFAVHDQGLNGLGVDRYLQHVEGQARGGLSMPTGMTRSIIEERPTRFAEIDVFFAPDYGPHHLPGPGRGR